MVGGQIPQSGLLRIAVISRTGAVLWAQAERAAVGDVLQIQGNWQLPVKRAVWLVKECPVAQWSDGSAVQRYYRGCA